MSNPDTPITDHPFTPASERTFNNGVTVRYCACGRPEYRHAAITAFGYTVICEDGRVRHSGSFASKAEADHFAEWGHCCTRNHTIAATREPVPVPIG
jgi:hypothetical protein